VKYQYSLKINK